MSLFAKRTLRGLFLAGVITALTTVGAAAADVATVTTDGLRLRSQASTDSAILAVASQGTTAQILADQGNGWYKVSYQGLEGYMSAQYLEVEPSPTATVAAEGSFLNVRSGPGLSHTRVGTLPDGAQVELLEEVAGGWYHVRTGDLQGYVLGTYLRTEETAPKKTDPAKPAPTAAANTAADAPTLPPEAEGVTQPAETAAPTTVPSTKGQEVVAYAETLLGQPYVYGGSGPNGFDCSGFVYYVYGHFDVTLNRGASGQMSNGKSVERADLQPGDLVFFNDGTVTTPASHVGIYVGEGRFIHASTNTNTVQYSDLEPGGVYDREYVGARRIFE